VSLRPTTAGYTRLYVEMPDTTMPSSHTVFERKLLHGEVGQFFGNKYGNSVVCN